MSENENEGISRRELDEEFNLDRMILFSDAVFAVVITLMAIEIKLPDSMESISWESLPQLLWHLAPAIVAYTVGYIFIGTIWYRQFLKVFALLKTYDKGLNGAQPCPAFFYRPLSVRCVYHNTGKLFHCPVCYLHGYFPGLLYRTIRAALLYTYTTAGLAEPNTR